MNEVVIYALDGALKATVPLSGSSADAPYDLVRTLSPTIDNRQASYLSIDIDATGSWIGAVGPFPIPDCFKVDDDGMHYVGMPFGMGFVALAPSTPVQAAALPEGSYTLRLSATDLAGRSAETTVAVAVERTAPEAEISAPVSGAEVSGVVAIAGRAADEHFVRYELWRATPDQVRTIVA